MTFRFQAKGHEAADLHAAIYRCRNDAGGVLIGQTPWSLALASIGARIPTLFDEQARHIGSAGKPIALGRHSRLLRALEGGGNVAVYGDRRICIGTTPSRVVFNAELFEKCAKAFVITHTSGARVRKLPRWVRYIAGARLRRAQKRAALSYAAGRIPEGMDTYF
jgi:ribulose-5-phosphate 4-epimerase/fuculose-1-phosphate aldolase